MISKALHNKLIKKWKKHGKVYQGRTKRVIDRLKWFSKHLYLLDGLNVLECGCNAGLFAIDICKHANYYIGMEKKPKYYKQAQITKEFLKIGNCCFVDNELKNYMGHKYNEERPLAVILSRVLYYLTNEDIEALKVILKTCKYALVFCGSAKDRGNNKYGFHKAENTKKFFEDNGMKFEVDLVHDRYYGGIALR